MNRDVVGLVWDRKKGIARKIRKWYNNIEDEKGLNWRKKPYMRKRNRKSNKTQEYFRDFGIT